MAITQLITYNGRDNYIIWDNNNPYKSLGDSYGPFLQWTVVGSDNYNNAFSKLYCQKFWRIGSEDESAGLIEYSLARLPDYTPPSGDPQNIYKMRGSVASSTSRMKTMDAAEETVDETLPNMIEVQIIGGQVTNVSIKSSGQNVTLIPNGDPASGQATIETTCGGSYNFLQLPVSDTYRIDVTKFSDDPFLKIFVRIPQADGTVSALNYDDVGSGETAATPVYFYVGRGNTDKSVRQLTAAETRSTSLQASENLVGPDYDDVLATAIEPPQNFSGVYQDGGVTLQWVNTTHPELAAVKIVRSLSDYPASPDEGTMVFDGLAETVRDPDVTQGNLCYYAAFSRKISGTYSEPTYFVVNTWRYSVYGRVTANGTGVAGVELELKDESGNQVAVIYTGSDGRYNIANLEMNPYELTARHAAYDIATPIRNVSLSTQNVEEIFSATATAALDLLLDLTTVLTGQTYEVPWSYRNIDNGESVNLSLCSGGNCSSLSHNLPILNGYVEWPVQGPAVADATLRLALSSNPAIYDEQALTVIVSTPSVSTATPTGIASTTATGGGNVTKEGEFPVTARGVCWSLSADPTTFDQTVPAGSGTGSFTCSITGLNENTTYFLRAYATNGGGTAYGENRSFKTLTTIGCPDCSGANPEITGKTFKEGTDCTCTGTESLTVGPNVVVEPGARATFKSGHITVKSKLEAKEGAYVKMSQ